MLKWFYITKTVPTKLVPKWQFLTTMSIEISNVIIGTPKTHILDQNDDF